MEFGGIETLIGAGGLLLIGYLATFWNKARNFVTKALSFIIVPQAIESSNMMIGILLTLQKNKKKQKRFGIRTFGIMHSYLKTFKTTRYVAYEASMGRSRLYWVGWRPVWVSFTKTESKSGSQGTDFMIKFIRWTFPYYYFINNSVEQLNEYQDRSEKIQDKNRAPKFYIEYVVGDNGSYAEKGNEATAKDESPTDSSGGVSLNNLVDIPIGFGWNDIGENRGKEAFADFITTNPQDVLLGEIDHWLNRQEWYQDKNMPWRRGYVLHGIPGSGKSSFIRAIGQKFDIPIFVFDLASMTNAYLAKKWRQKCDKHKQRIILIEDIDGVFNMRKNMAVSDKNVMGVTFDMLLNVIDGVDRHDGTLLFITTNKIEILDPALGGQAVGNVESRPGRVDRVVKLGYMNEAGRAKLIDRICGDFMSKDEVQELAQQYKQITPASLQEVCFRKALENEWKDKGGNGAIKEQVKEHSVVGHV